MCGREGGALHVCRVLQFSHATANSTRRQIRDSRLQRVWLEGARKGGIGTESWLLSLHKHCGREHSEIRTTSECRRPLLCAVAR